MSRIRNPRFATGRLEAKLNPWGRAGLVPAGLAAAASLGSMIGATSPVRAAHLPADLSTGTGPWRVVGGKDPCPPADPCPSPCPWPGPPVEPDPDPWPPLDPGGPGFAW